MKIFLKTFTSAILLCALMMSTLLGCAKPEDQPSSETTAANTTSEPLVTTTPITEAIDPQDTLRWKIATTTGDLKGRSGYYLDEKVIRGLHEAGFKYIDLSMYSFARNDVYLSDNWREEVLKLKAVADELGMKFVQAHSQGGNPLSARESEFIVKATLRSIEICEVLGIKNTVVHAGYNSGLTKEEWFQKNKEFYDLLLPTAERCGVKIWAQITISIPPRICLSL